MEKTIIRTSKKDNPYVLIDKTFLKDTCLSWKAKGLMAFLLSKPDDWQVMISNLVNQSPDGRDAVYSTIKELIKAGYMVKKIIRDEKGRFLGFEYLVYERPQVPDSNLEKEKSEINSGGGNEDDALENTCRNPFPGFPDTALPGTANPYTDFPDTVEPDTENPTLLNNDLILNNDLTNNPPYNPPRFSDIEKSEGERVKISPDEAKTLEPVSIALFGQYNLRIVEKLREAVSEFEINDECIQECLKSIDTGKIRFNPYAYFRIRYMVAIAVVAKRRKNQDSDNWINNITQREEIADQEPDVKSAEYMIKHFRLLKEQLTKT